ncbi:hypothetical protein ICM_01705 [Bacillus cereus BAG1X2-3]|uniref:Uncharacterized protein n=2 Tax=Bacillus cereus group TaxID=86661 RepID=A0A9X7EAQ1_BACCE|nr:hypothetical protein AC241_12165 [Bacillus thuringiensis]EOO27449.1 hypothetical protein ICC_03112 [Bacillus cereus BAG1X1-1]EOO49749.1 hypothetical protein ICI_02267 [Bacillus cereus BAG1X2-1]EOO51883.1 hypothetical protein ICK_03083 [Bacillus cereus BAG1X2-2]EOO60051.1 hypothetical protein ICM_01705 [Bacillus cereus BAG1X2-3]EOP06668.1 hypothetical protein ICO_02267 [Bacillus cereus BAG2O-1]KMP95953.1 hypothetical protein TU67_27095 [Bacillus cereus]
MDGLSTLKAILAVAEETLSKGMFLLFKSHSKPFNKTSKESSIIGILKVSGTIILTKISKYNLYFFF